MPKNNDAGKSKMRSKSMRKPVRDVSNAKTAVKSANSCKKTAVEDGGKQGDDSLDRLLLVQSDLSSLMRQIDELVVQALQLTGNKGRKEIKQFADVLSDMQTSLKPWIPRFKKALLSQSTPPENKQEQRMEKTEISPPKETITTIIESPEETKSESLVSPSPLVSWRAECKTEGGRQLFLLTPLPQSRAFSSKRHASSIHSFQNLIFDDMPEDLTKNVGNLEKHCVSPSNFSKMNCSMFVMTPCLKMSPPKSCTLLEPASEFSRKSKHAVHKSTPFPVGAQYSESQESDSSSSRSSDELNVKYPELFGIKLNDLGNKRVEEEDSPDWMVSPPKTCVVMEPTDEKLLTNVSNNCLSRTAEVRNQHQDISTRFDVDTNCTPMVKEPMSNYRTGKHPGENTLKKELWTRFEAASSPAIRFYGSILQKNDRKGFLDKLEEAFDDE